MTSASDTHVVANRLRRAENVLQANGRPAEALAVDCPLSRRRSLTVSIKHRFKKAKDGLIRSKSEPRPLPESSESSLPVTFASKGPRPPDNRTRSSLDVSRHSFSYSRHSSTVYRSSHKKNFSLQFRMESLSRVAEAITTGPVAENSMPDPQTDEHGGLTVPNLLQLGTPMTKVSNTRQKKFIFRVDPDMGQIIYESKSHKIIPIECIKEMRFGSDARYDREQFQMAKEYEDRWITIIYILDGNYKTLHLIAATPDVFNMWRVTLIKLFAIRQQLMSGLGNIEMRQAIWEKHYWKGADAERDQKLAFEEVERLCKRLNINSSTQDLRRLFKQADVDDRGYLDFEDFRGFVKLLKNRPEVDRLYKKLRDSSSGGEFTFATFENFMKEKQKSILSSEELRAIFTKYTTPSTPSSPVPNGSTPTKPLSPSLVMSLDAFTSFLLSAENSAIADCNKTVWHDMTRPLSEYFISSSHNTYLVGHQLVGVSTVEGYIRALLHSCRSVEVDIYDGDTEPMIFHGKTLTSKVSFRQVCEAINKYGFVTSPYPIIISAEVHCGIAQQEMLARIMLTVFGDSLVCAPPDGRPTITQLPSPEELKGKILLKAKNLLIVHPKPTPQPGDIVVSDTSASSASDSDFVHDLKADWDTLKKDENFALSELKEDLRKARTNVILRMRGQKSTKSSDTKAKPKMSMELVALLVYTVGVKCRGINRKEDYAPEHLFSLSESTASKMMKVGMIELIKHNRTHLVRIYPKGLRLGSSNYEPHRFWSAGCQLVALNWQTFDLGYMINHSMFQLNGRSGYVLKPEALRDPHKDLLSRQTKHYLELSIISAQQLPRPKDSSGREIMDKSIVDPFVEVSVHVPDWYTPANPSLDTPSNSVDVSTATAAKTMSYRTSVVKNNGFNPIWEENLRIPFTCAGNMKNLIFVRFTIRREGGDDDEPIGFFCASLGNLQSGYRHLPLHDAQMSQYLFSTLFVRISIQDIS